MKLYLCPVCGNVIYMMNGDVGNLKCCSREMMELKPNSVDASLEKHVPLCEINGDKVNVKVGEIMHPMDSDHYIMWVILDNGTSIEIVHFKPGMDAVTTFNYVKGSIIYAYCNKHGLWKKEI